MNREIELKVIGLDMDKLEEKVVALGGKLIAQERQKNIIIDTAEKLPSNSYLRIREKTDSLSGKFTSELTYKENRASQVFRDNIELETSLGNSNNMIEILGKLGYEVLTIGYKDRKSYELRGARLDFDSWDKETYPESYMEIEADSKEDLERIINILDIGENHISSKSIAELREDLKK